MVGFRLCHHNADNGVACLPFRQEQRLDNPSTGVSRRPIMVSWTDVSCVSKGRLLQWLFTPMVESGIGQRYKYFITLTIFYLFHSSVGVKHDKCGNYIKYGY